MLCDRPLTLDELDLRALTPEARDARLAELTAEERATRLDPEDPPATFEELRAAAQALVDRDVAEAGLALELSPWYVEQWFERHPERAGLLTR